MVFYLEGMRNMLLFAPLLIIFSISISAQSTIKISDDLVLIQLTPDVYIHKSYVTSETYGRFACNGILYTRLGDGLLFDTPYNESQTELLLTWIKDSLGIVIEGVIVNHFHEDCLGGLSVVHQWGIPSYGYKGTQKLAKANSLTPPQKTFGKKRIFKLNDRKIVCQYFGPAHTQDNIACWFPSEKMLFGGCMLKSLKSGKGNLADAEVSQWSYTIRNIKVEFPDIQIAVPGHGKYGGIELLDYTIDMFKADAKKP